MSFLSHLNLSPAARHCGRLSLFVFGSLALRSVASYNNNHPPSASSTLRSRLKAGTTLNASEMVQIVESSTNAPLRGATRSEMRMNKLPHRATYIFLVDPRTKRLHVQRRSDLKDYCPGYLDPTPGGVVGVGEGYGENAERELEEEMGLKGVPLRRMFTFHYVDDAVDCWGDAYEAEWTGRVEDLKLQEEEVSEVMMMGVDEVLERDESGEDKFTKDSVHAVRLYKQWKEDEEGGEGGGVERNPVDDKDYRLRPRPSAVFFDCDDCLYFDGWVLAARLTAKIETYCSSRLGLPEGKAYDLYKKWGTALLGLIEEGYLKTEEEISEYLEAVHDVGVETVLKPNERLRSMLESLDPSLPKFIFTASVKSHAVRCLKALGIDHLFPPSNIIDTRVCGYQTKHSQSSFRKAQEFAGVPDPGGCVFFDDSVKNLRAAKEQGWRGFLVGRVGRDDGKPVKCDEAEAMIDDILKARDAVPEIFV